MATNQNNPASTPNLAGPSQNHQVLRSSPVRKYSTGVLADDATFTLGATADAKGFYRCWDSADLTNVGQFSVDADSTVTLEVPIVTGSVWVAADTDTKLCFFDDSGVLTVKNRSGGALTLHFSKLI